MQSYSHEPSVELTNLFECLHLTLELANENLLFWREAIKYKLQFDRNRDFEVSQQTAKVIYRTFIASDAVLPINISSHVKRGIDSRFKGAVGRTVFDEALVEVYLMIQDGAFRRFIRSAPFKEFSATRADFSMAGDLNPMAILPEDSPSPTSSAAAAPSPPTATRSLVDPETATSKAQINIREYISSL